MHWPHEYKLWRMCIYWKCTSTQKSTPSGRRRHPRYAHHAIDIVDWVYKSDVCAFTTWIEYRLWHMCIYWNYTSTQKSSPFGRRHPRYAHHSRKAPRGYSTWVCDAFIRVWHDAFIHVCGMTYSCMCVRWRIRVISTALSRWVVVDELQRVAAFGSVLQCIAVYCSVLQCDASTWYRRLSVHEL